MLGMDDLIANTFHDARFNPLSANPTKWSNTLNQFVGKFSDELFECI